MDTQPETRDKKYNFLVALVLVLLCITVFQGYHAFTLTEKLDELSQPNIHTAQNSSSPQG